MKIVDYIFKYRIRKCKYCGKIKFCEWVRYILHTKHSKEVNWVRSNEGYFCKDCQKLSVEVIFEKIGNNQLIYDDCDNHIIYNLQINKIKGEIKWKK